MQNYPIKIIIAGQAGTGKSTLISAKKTGCFNFASKMTIGVDFTTIDIKRENIKIQFLVYDLGGQKRFQFLHDSYIKGAKAGIILYDLTRETTFKSIVKWISLLRSENPNIPVLICGSKKDLAQPEDLIIFEKKWKLLTKNNSSNYNLIGHMFISSKTFEGIDNTFSILAEYLISSTILFDSNKLTFKKLITKDQ